MLYGLVQGVVYENQQIHLFYVKYNLGCHIL